MNTNTPKYTEMIDRYLSGELSGEEKRSFEAELLINPQLKEELQLEKDLYRILADEKAINLRKKLTMIMKEAKQPKTVKLSASKTFLRIAATITLLIGLTTVWSVFNQKSMTNEELFNQYYETDNNLSLYRSGDTKLVEAIRYYQAKEFEQAIVSFENFLDNEPGNVAVHFYTGISYIEVAHYEKAIEEFNYIIKDKNNLYIEHAEWYLGLCYLKKEDKELAVEKFTEIANNKESFYQNEASKLLKELQKKSKSVK